MQLSNRGLNLPITR